MTCAEFQDLILDDIDGRLPPETLPLLRTHLAACESCRSFLSAQIDLDRLLEDPAHPQLSPSFASEVLARVAAAEPRRAPGIGFVFAWDLAGLAGVAAAAAFAVLRLCPNLLLGGPWVAAASILCVGACFVLGDLGAPHP